LREEGETFSRFYKKWFGFYFNHYLYKIRGGRQDKKCDGHQYRVGCRFGDDPGWAVRNDHLTKIITQKFIAQTPWLPLETWSDHRRLGLPFFENVVLESPINTLPTLSSGNLNTSNVQFFPQRIVCPSSLKNSNINGYNQAPGRRVPGPASRLTIGFVLTLDGLTCKHTNTNTRRVILSVTTIYHYILTVALLNQFLPYWFPFLKSKN
jgi:hypothetical protein